MRIITKIVFLCFSTASFFGCVSPGKTTVNYFDSDGYKVKNERFYDKDPGTVWDVLVGELSKSFFMINNINKTSRIVNISFSSKTPCLYVDCGSVEVRVKKSNVNKIGKSFYKFSICESKEYVSEGHGLNNSGIKAPIICRNTTNPKLEGRMNIYVAPQGDGTLVTVNSRYILNIKLESYCDFYAPAGNYVNSAKESNSYECSFDTKRSELCRPVKGDPFICYSTGDLEKEILDLVK